MIQRILGARAVPIPSRPLLILAIALMATGLSACGRRGPLEPPPVASGGAPVVPAAQPQDEDDADANSPMDAIPSVAPPPSQDRASRRGFTVPKRPFILDPLL